jgi:hypothetical protein
MDVKKIIQDNLTRIKLPAFMHYRSNQLGVALFISIVVACSYALKLKDARHLLADQTQQIRSLSDEKTNQDKEVTLLRSQVEFLLSPPGEADSRKPINPVESLYNPEESASGNQALLDGLKKRYEEILVTFFFLKKCNKINPTDFHVIVSALSQEMASINAPGRLEHDIVTAAQGSYKEMYSQTACNSQTIDSLYTQYSAYIASLANNFIVK